LNNCTVREKNQYLKRVQRCKKPSLRPTECVAIVIEEGYQPERTKMKTLRLQMQMGSERHRKRREKEGFEGATEEEINGDALLSERFLFPYWLRLFCRSGSLTKMM